MKYINSLKKLGVKLALATGLVATGSAGCYTELDRLRTYFTPVPGVTATTADLRIDLGNGSAPDLGISFYSNQLFGFPASGVIPLPYIDWADSLGLNLEERLFSFNNDKQKPILEITSTQPEGNVYFASNTDVRNGKELLSFTVKDNNPIFVRTRIFKYGPFNEKPQRFERDDSLLVELVNGIEDEYPDGTDYVTRTIKISPRDPGSVGTTGEDLEGRRIISIGAYDGNNFVWYAAELNVLDINAMDEHAASDGMIPPGMNGLNDLAKLVCSDRLAPAVDDPNTPDKDEGADIRFYRIGTDLMFDEIPVNQSNANAPENFVHHKVPKHTSIVVVPGLSLQDPISYSIVNKRGTVQGFQPMPPEFESTCRNFIITDVSDDARAVIVVASKENKSGQVITAEVIEAE